MPVSLKFQETDEHVILVWKSDGMDDFLPNYAGVKTPHLTKIIKGEVKYHFGKFEDPIVLRAGDELAIPVNTAYLFTAESPPVEIRCFYPKSDPEGIVELEHLREFDGKTIPLKREE